MLPNKFGLEEVGLREWNSEEGFSGSSESYEEARNLTTSAKVSALLPR